MTHINLRRDTAATWAAVNPVLPEGQTGWESDTLKAKLGDGVTAWNALPYAVDSAPVTSVAARTGDVVLTAADVGLTNVDNTSDSAKPISVATQAALDLKAALESPVFTGNPTAPTPDLADNDTSIATTAFVQAVAAAVVASAEATGVIKAFAGNVAPDGYYICDGSEKSRTEDAALFAVCGTTYGAGDGSTTFNVPDLRNRTPVGTSPNKLLGSSGGAANITLTTAQMPKHRHTTQFQWVADVPTTGSAIRVLRIDGKGAGGSSGTLESANTSEVGSNASVNIQNPYLATQYIIKR